MKYYYQFINIFFVVESHSKLNFEVKDGKLQFSWSEATEKFLYAYKVRNYFFNHEYQSIDYK